MRRSSSSRVVALIGLVDIQTLPELVLALYIRRHIATRGVEIDYKARI